MATVIIEPRTLSVAFDVTHNETLNPNAKNNLSHSYRYDRVGMPHLPADIDR